MKSILFLVLSEVIALSQKKSSKRKQRKAGRLDQKWVGYTIAYLDLGLFQKDIYCLPKS